MINHVVAFWVLCGAAADLAALDPNTTVAEQTLAGVVQFIDSEMAATTTLATKTEQTLQQTPAIITTITAEQIRTAGYRSVSEALAMVPGLAQNTDHVFDNIGVRGISGGLRGGSRDIKFMLDGQPIAFRPDAQNLLGPEGIPIDVIERIEVIRGPASALYGANAYLGVVNIISKSVDADGSPDAALRLDGGSLVQGMAYGGGLWALDRFSGTDVVTGITYAHQDRSGLQLPADSINAGDFTGNVRSRSDIARPLSVFTKVRQPLGDLGTLHFDGLYQGLHSGGEFVDSGALSHGSTIALNNGYVRAVHDITLGWGSLHSFLAFAAGAAADDDRITPVLLGAPLAYSIGRSFGYNAIDVGSEAAFALADITLLVGIENSSDFEHLRRNTYITTQTQEALQSANRGTQLFSNTGAYAQGLYKLTQWLRLDANARFDYHNIFGGNFNYRAAVVAKGSSAWYAKAISGSSYRAPTAEQLYGTPYAPGGVVGALVSSDPSTLEPQTAINHELLVGYHVDAPSWQLDATVNGFYTSAQNRIEYLLTQGLLQPVNLDSSQTWGTELTVDYIANAVANAINLHLIGSWSFQDTQISQDQIAVTPRQQIISAVNEIYPRWMAKGSVFAAFTPLHVAVQAQIVYYSERLESQINQSMGRPFVTTPLRYVPKSYPLDITVSSYGVEFWPEHETHIALRLRDVLNSQGVDPGFTGINIPPLGRRATLSLTQNF